MKLAILTTFAALASSALAVLSINNPVAGTVWPHDGSDVSITWISDDNTLLTGTVTVQLMGGNDPNNLIPVLTIASKIPASAKKVTFRPPKDLPGSSTYAVRVTSTVSGPHYSHMFKAGDPTIKDSPTHSDKSSESNSNSDSKDKSSSASDSHTGSESDEESSDKNSSDEEHSSNEENGTSDSETNTDTTSGASSFAATGILGIAVGAIAASLF